jgi:hypothetical protein
MMDVLSKVKKALNISLGLLVDARATPKIILATIQIIHRKNSLLIRLRKKFLVGIKL